MPINIVLRTPSYDPTMAGQGNKQSHTLIYIVYSFSSGDHIAPTYAVTQIFEFTYQLSSDCSSSDGSSCCKLDSLEDFPNNRYSV